MRRRLALMAMALLSAGCASTSGVGYYWQSVTGHLRLMQAARPVDAWLADAQTPPNLKDRLALAQRIRAFAVTELALPDNASYHRYADLQRRAAVYNVVAAPTLSLTLQTWCFPVAGCVGYRGYYREADARAFAAGLDRGLEVAVYPVPAYSTLGWMNWAGGDPLLNTFIRQPEGELARLLFHELAHQVVYAKDDTTFNESFATAVERLGVQRWLAQASTPGARVAYEAFDQRRRAFGRQAHAFFVRALFSPDPQMCHASLKSAYPRRCACFIQRSAALHASRRLENHTKARRPDCPRVPHSRSTVYSPNRL